MGSVQVSKLFLLALFPHGKSSESRGVITLSFSQLVLTIVPWSNRLSLFQKVCVFVSHFSLKFPFLLSSWSRLFHFVFFLLYIDLSLQMKSVKLFYFFVTSGIPVQYSKRPGTAPPTMIMISFIFFSFFFFFSLGLTHCILSPSTILQFHKTNIHAI